MRVLGIGDYNSLADMHWRLGRQGHEVRVYVGEAEGHDIFENMVHRVDDWRDQLPWVRAAGREGLIVFESTSHGALQDQLRADGYHVIGSSAWGDTLENDREYGQAVMRQAGLRTGESWEFDRYQSAIDFLRARPQRVVFKFCDEWADKHRNYVGQAEDGSDVAALLRKEQQRAPPGDKPPKFILMRHLEGVEIGIGGYFDGRRFLRPVCLDWEHKRFFPGDVGELTGEMGTLVTYRGYEPLYAETLAKLEPVLARGGYRGYLNLNMIVNAEGIWPLEFTCRFGYPGFAILDALQPEGWAPFLLGMAHGAVDEIETLPGYALGVVLTVPPFPYEYGYQNLSKGMRLQFKPTMSEAERKRLHFGEVGLRDGELVTAGSIGYVAVATGVGADAPAAQREAYALVSKVLLPNMRYRNDIGQRFIDRDEALLRQWGWLR